MKLLRLFPIVLLTLLFGGSLAGASRPAPMTLRESHRPARPALPSASAGAHIQTATGLDKQFGGLTNHNLQLDSAGHPHLAYGGDYLY